MRQLIFLVCFLCWFQARSAPPTYTFSRGGDCNLKINRGATLDNSMNLQDLTWREPKRRDIIEVRDYSTSFSCRNEQVTNYVADQVDSLIAQLTVWKDSCLLEGGGAADLNFAMNDLTFDGNRTHATAGNDLTISGAGTTTISSTVGSGWSGGLLNSQSLFGAGAPGYGVFGSNSNDGMAGLLLFGDLTNIGLGSPRAMFRALGNTGTNFKFLEQALMDTTSQDLTYVVSVNTDGAGEAVSSINNKSFGSGLATTTIQNTSAGAGTSRVVLRADADGSGQSTIEVYARGNATTGGTSNIGIINQYGGERALRFTESFWVISDSLSGVLANEQYQYPYTNQNTALSLPDGNIDGRSFAINGADSTMTWTGGLQTATGDGTTTIDWRENTNMDFQFGASNETFTFTAPPFPCFVTISLKQDGVGSRTATWPASVKWSGGSAPTLTTTPTTGYDIIGLRYDGTNYYQYTVVLDLQ